TLFSHSLTGSSIVVILVSYYHHLCDLAIFFNNDIFSRHDACISSNKSLMNFQATAPAAKNMTPTTDKDRSKNQPGTVSADYFAVLFNVRVETNVGSRILQPDMNNPEFRKHQTDKPV